MQSQEERRSYWGKIVADQAESGLTRKEFCRQHNIVLSQFAY